MNSPSNSHLADKLHDFGKIVLHLQNLLELCSQHDKLGVILLVPRLKRLDVFGIGNVPVERREVFALRELLVQAPEDLHDGKCRRRDGVRKISSGRRYCSDNGDGAVTLRVSETGNLAGTLVERGETGTKVGGVTRVWCSNDQLPQRREILDLKNPPAGISARRPEISRKASAHREVESAIMATFMP